jgi:tetratricopeptide (TPR) repeat protein
VTAPPPTCPKCGLRLDPTTGLCLFCSSPADAPPPVAAAAAGGGQADSREHELGLLLFEAEESLARGAVEKAVVLASRAVKERPDSLIARALQERARRELLRGRRRDRLEARVREAEGLLEAGDAAGADRIVTSALKLIPNHPVALALFAKLKERRQQASTAEAWAEQELERLTKARARRALDAAQAEMAAGRDRAAMMTLRRGLRHAPDDPELLARLQDVEKTVERGKAGQHAVQAQVRAGLDLLAQGQLEESIKVLRAVLRADPDNGRAQVAVQQVRKAWLRRQGVAAVAPPMEGLEPHPAPVEPAEPMAPPPAPEPPAPAAARPSPPAPAPAAAAPPPRPSSPPARTASWDDVEALAKAKAPIAKRAPAPVPPQAASPPPARVPVAAAPASPEAARPALPKGAILAGVVVLLVVGAIVVSRRSPRQPPAPVAAPTAAAPATVRPAAPANGTQLPGPLDAADPALRQSIEAVLASYGRALETADASLLAEARPDLSAEDRARLIAAFTGAINAATDLRVLDINARGDLATVSVLRTDVIVGGTGGPRDPTEETLRFWRRRGEWLLVR